MSLRGSSVAGSESVTGVNWNQLWLLGKMHGWGMLTETGNKWGRPSPLTLLLPPVILLVTRGDGNPEKGEGGVRQCGVQSSFST